MVKVINPETGHLIKKGGEIWTKLQKRRKRRRRKRKRKRTRRRKHRKKHRTRTKYIILKTPRKSPRRTCAIKGIDPFSDPRPWCN